MKSVIVSDLLLRTNMALFIALLFLYIYIYISGTPVHRPLRVLLCRLRLRKDLFVLSTP